MIAHLANAARVTAFDASIIVGRARSKLESVFDHRRADTILWSVVRRALRSKQPIDAIERDVKFIVGCAVSVAARALMATPIVARSEEQRQRSNYVRKRKRMQERDARNGVSANE